MTRTAITTQVDHFVAAEKIADAEAKASTHLGNANQARERGDRQREERELVKAQRWLDRANRLRGWGS